MKPPRRKSTSGKGPRRGSGEWAAKVAELCAEVGLQCTTDLRPHLAGKPGILRIRDLETDADGSRLTGIAVLTLYGTGSWTWGGDADVVAHVRDPLDLHGLLPTMGGGAS